MQNQAKGAMYASMAAFLWGFLAIALKVATREFDSITIVWFRFGIAFTILLVWNIVRSPKEIKILTKPPVWLILAALALGWNYLGFMYGVQYTSPSNAQLFIQVGPVTLAIIGIVFFKEKPGKWQKLGFIFVLAGMYLFYNEQIKAFVHSAGKYNIGVLLTISGALAWAIYAVIQRNMVQKFPVSTLNLVLFGLPFILYSPFIDLHPFLHLGWEWWLLAFFLGLNTLGAYTFVAAALKYTEANKVSVIIILNPMITFSVMAFLTYSQVSWVDPEFFTILSVAGALILLCGAFLVVKK